MGTPDDYRSRVKRRLHEVIFEADTVAGKAFDVVLLITILASILVVMLESVESLRESHGSWLLAAEWTFTILFTVEYVLRLACVGRPWRYATSFFGVVDLLAVIPTYISLAVPRAQALLVLRVLRLLRVFRVLKLTRFLHEAHGLMLALRRASAKIVVFLTAILSIVLIMGSLMYLIEGPENGFESIPQSVYWAIVTMTTVGYGDITPKTVPGQAFSALAMILGYSIIIVPIGVFSVEAISARETKVSRQACPSCSAEGHDIDAVHCKYCGAKL
jgi:voltage-gated potassium channel